MVYRADTTLLSHRSVSGLPGIKRRSGSRSPSSFSFFPVMLLMYVKDRLELGKFHEK
jgi:hypothetical protein